MNNSELNKVLESKILNTGKLLIAHQGIILCTGSPSRCGLALIERERSYNTEHLIFIYSFGLNDDLSCDQVLPVDSEFICDFRPAEGSSNVRVELRDSGGVSVVLELPTNQETDAFVDEVYRVVDASKMKKSSSSSMLTTSVQISDSLPIDQSFLNAAMDREKQNIAKGGQYSITAREKMIKRYMDERVDEYTYLDKIRVLAATWNVNGKGATISLLDWLAVDPDPPDIYAIGFQELDNSKEAFIFNETLREGEWYEAVTNALCTRKSPYMKVSLVRLVGMMLIVFVKESHMEFVRNVTAETVGTGIMGKMGNKGGVGVRLDFHSTSICFVNSHFAAHVEEFERRNQDFMDINARMIFNMPSGQRLSIKDHNQVYWLGDLNYRVTQLDPTVVKSMLKHNEIRSILEYDQLMLQKRQRKVFEGYTEGAITFQPTYKYDTGTDDWDSSEKNRAPAWCDRVLTKGDGIRQINYRSHPSLRISDHKPVTSLFEAKIRIIDESRQRKVHEYVSKYLDKLENEAMPQVTVDTNEIVFDTIRYLEPVAQEVIVANTGQVPAQFQFINKLDEETFCKSWLHVEPHEGLILPGEKCDVRLEVLIDKRSACRMNSGEDKLYDILVLHLLNGKDIFITVTGVYERSCFGSSIEALVHVSVPIRELSIGELMKLENSKEIRSGPEPYPIPKEIWFLVDHLYRHGLKYQLFVRPGIHSEIIQIRNWLDNGSTDQLPGSVYSMAEALLLLLDSSAESVIPYNLLHVCLNASSEYIRCKQIVQSLPIHRRNVFLYLCVFLQELLSHSSENELEAKCLAKLFGGIFLRDPPARKSEPRDKASLIEMDNKRTNFVYHFLVNDQSDFILGR